MSSRPSFVIAVLPKGARSFADRVSVAELEFFKVEQFKKDEKKSITTKILICIQELF